MEKLNNNSYGGGTQMGRSLFPVRPFYMQSIFIVCGFHTCKFTYSLKFICKPQINTCFHGQSFTNVLSIKKFELPDVSTSS